jgi:uncharacterized phiE125 gp8 family phage protein
MALDLVSIDSTTEPINVFEVRVQARLSTDNADGEDDLLQTFASAARQRAEIGTRRQLIGPAHYALRLNAFPCEPWIELPRPPLVEVESVSYVDVGGTTRTLVEGTDYLVDAPVGEKPRRGRVALLAGVTWPVTADQINAVMVRFTAGYNKPSDVPAILRAAMLRDAATLYEGRENVVTGTIVATLPGGSLDVYLAYRSLPTQRLTGYTE